jgi:hypothetical protein
MKYRQINPFGTNPFMRWPRFLALMLTIWIPFIPAIIMDVIVEIYHRTAFPMYGFDYIRRGDYIIIDRQKLKYLSRIEKINCMYCGYMNGLFEYWSKIARQTELFWCGIKHHDYPAGEFDGHENYARYNDPDDLELKYPRDGIQFEDTNYKT